MTSYRFRIVNVFAESTFGGNPLCVFEDATGMSDETMQALARQFNLSETTFLFPSERADARMRIFTPGAELPFAGHPTLGTAHVLRALKGGDRLSLECMAGAVPVTADGDAWTLTAPTGGMPAVRAAGVSAAFAAGLVGLDESDLAGEPAWVDTGNEQLLIPVRNADAVARAAPDARLLSQWPASRAGRKNAYLFAFDSADDDVIETAPVCWTRRIPVSVVPARFWREPRGVSDLAPKPLGSRQRHAGTTNQSRINKRVIARYFFAQPGGGMAEDPGTGSACANLGGWLIAAGRPLPARCLVQQGDAISRPCRLSLEVTEQRAIRVGGRVIEIGSGSGSVTI